MKRMMWLAAAGIGAVFAAPALAEEDGFYLKGGIGVGGFDTVEVRRGGVEGVIGPDGDARLMVGGGYAFSNGWRLDLDVMDRYADGGAVNDTAVSTTDIQSVAVMFNAIKQFDAQGPVDPYLGVGIGSSINDVGYAGNVLGPAFVAQEDKTHTAYQALAGLAIEVSNRVSADVEYRYTDIGNLNFTGFSFNDVEAHDVLFGLRFALSGGSPAPAPAPAPAPPTAPVAAAPAMTCDNVDFIVYFEWDRSDLTDQAAATVEAAAGQADECGITRVMIEGHADRSGPDDYNVRLSDRRARVVRDALVRLGVAASTISVEARGENDPAVDTPDGVREPLNRRSEVEIIVSGPSS